MIRCIDCGEEIPDERVEILRSKNWPMRCVKCSKVEGPIGFMNFGHKTGGEVLIVPRNPDGTNDPEKIRQARRAYRRDR